MYNNNIFIIKLIIYIIIIYIIKNLSLTFFLLFSHTPSDAYCNSVAL